MKIYKVLRADLFVANFDRTSTFFNLPDLFQLYILFSLDFTRFTPDCKILTWFGVFPNIQQLKLTSSDKILTSRSDKTECCTVFLLEFAYQRQKVNIDLYFLFLCLKPGSELNVFLESFSVAFLSPLRSSSLENYSKIPCFFPCRYV